MPPRRSQRHRAIAPPPPAAAAPILPPRSAVSFLDLPPEIRNTIYLLVVPQNEPITPNVRVLFSEARKRERTNEPFISHETTLVFARTCKQIYDEMIPIYFGGNQFRFIDLYQMYQFLYMIGYERRRCLQSIEVLLVNPGHKNRGRGRYRVKQMKRLEGWVFDLLADSIVLNKLSLGVTYYVATLVPGGDYKVYNSKLSGVVESFIASRANLDVVVGRVRYSSYPHDKFWVDTGIMKPLW